MSTWTVQGDNISGTLAELSLANLRRTRVSQARDTATFDAPGAAYDGAALFSYGESVTIKKDDATWFQGPCITIPRLGEARDERITYELAGPWWYLEKCIYLQVWRVYSVADAELQNAYKSRGILCQDSDGNRITSGAQIQAAINYCISKGAPITLGTVDPDIQIPWEECTDITCAEVIVRMLRWSPDCVAWFDYSTASPTFHCRKRSNLEALSLACASGAPASRLFIKPRYDLQAPGVSLRYEQSHSVGAQTYETVELDEAGDVDAIDTVISTIELAGSRASVLTQKIVTADWPSPMTDKDWWTARVPWLGDLDANYLTIHDVSTDPSPTLERILSEGTVQDWMDEDQADVVVTAQIDYTEKDGNGDPVEVIKNKKVSLRLIATDAETSTYRKLGVAVSGESVPTGVAAALYAAWSQLQYDGEFTLIEEEVTGAASPGRKLNLTGGLAAWASMDALIYRVNEYVDKSQTTITFGPQRHLGPDELVGLLRAFRTRNVAIGYNLRVSGDSADADSSVGLSGPAPKNEPASGGGETQMQLIKNSAGDKSIGLDPDDATADGQIIQFWTDGGVRKGTIQYAKFHS